AMTMDIFSPKDKEKANGKGIIWCVSGGWFSAKEMINPSLPKVFVDRGYTVFAVVHGSQPKFTIPEVLNDMHRAVRFIKANAKKYNVDPDKLGIAGASAGGHLSLMQGCAPKEGNPKGDPVEQQSSKVAAVACFFPPTDFLNYGKEGESGLGEGILKDFKAPFDFHELTKEARPHYAPITDPARRREIGKQISPAYHVTKESAPAL